MSFTVIIPARYASVRLPGKPLRQIAGKPMIQWVYESAVHSKATRIIIATDDYRIQKAATEFGAEVVLTSENHQSGTERIAEVVDFLDLPEDEIIVNLQGDEPLMPQSVITQTALALDEHKEADMSTVCVPILSSDELFDHHIVKVVRDAEGYAMYFSRAPIPWDRDEFKHPDRSLTTSSLWYRHVGLYAYRAGFLGQYTGWKPSLLEQKESLEQLRVLWHGKKIIVIDANEIPGPGVDTEDDLKNAERLLQA